MKKSIAWAALILAVTLFAGCSTLTSGIAGGIMSSIGGSSDQQRASGGCGDPFGGTSGRSSKGTGQSVNLDWPKTELADYGLGALVQPVGSKVVNVALYQGTYYIALEEAGKDAYDNLIAQIKKITGAKTPFSLVKSENGELCEYQYGEHLVSLAVDFVEKTILVRLLR